MCKSYCSYSSWHLLRATFQKHILFFPCQSVRGAIYYYQKMFGGRVCQIWKNVSQIGVLRADYERMIRALQEGFTDRMPEHAERREIMKRVEAFLALDGVEYADMDKLCEVLENVFCGLLVRQPDDFACLCR